MSSIMLNRINVMNVLDTFSAQKIIFVQAPAGYGKTVTIMQWLNRDNCSKAVISLDEYDNEQSGFLYRFCLALKSCQPSNRKLNEIVTDTSFKNAPIEFAFRAINALAIRKKAIIMIDDLHLINNDNVIKILLILLNRLPDNFKVVLISRTDLPHGFSDLLVKGQAGRLTAEQLSFQEQEILSLCEKRGAPVSPVQAAEINRITHGWAIGINAFLLSGGKLSDEIYDYLDEFINTNIWLKWDDDIRGFMLRTSLLYELDPSLCAWLTGEENSVKILQKLFRTGAFISNCGDGVYRYHHLFKSFLGRKAKEQGEEFINSLWDAEGSWYLMRQDFYKAAENFIRCKNLGGIAKAWALLETINRNDFAIEKVTAIEKYAEVREAAKLYPFIYYMMAYAACAEGCPDKMILYADKYYAHYDEIALREPNFSHNILYMNIWDFRVSLFEVIERAQKVKIKNKKKIACFSGTISMYMPLFHRSILDFSDLSLGCTEENTKIFSDKAGWLFGEEWELLSCLVKAGLHYERAGIEQAHAYALRAVAAIKDYYPTETKFCAMSILVYILDVLDSPEAGILTERIALLIEEEQAYHLNHNYNALRATRKIRCGDIKAAKLWLDEYPADLYSPPALSMIYISFTTCKALIITGAYDSAMIVLKKLLDMSRIYNRPIDAIESLILLAIACWKRKRLLQKEALRYLEEAVSLAYPYEFTQKFIHYGAELSGMLFKLQKRIEQQNREELPPTSFFKMVYYKVKENVDITQIAVIYEEQISFTDKQKAVMKLLCEGKSYQEMADNLGIKLPTLRSHISLIYEKLDVANKIDAINKIKVFELF
ncbi:MAG: LuxR C-terminal-related transcriptional regulator [Lachnospiraceae bacterium]|nr:LuxR C-terminal-related transcriptional regulator [Lachnospiraceae bacterium]